jgi:glycosyltransferase involved in cell wall biosynthesis
MTSRPSILAISSELPWPLDTGGHIRSFHVLTGLARSCRVLLVAGVSSRKAEGVEALRHRGVDVAPVELRDRTTHGEVARALAAAARRDPYVLYRRHDRAEMRAAVRTALGAHRPDVVYFDHLDSAVFADLLRRERVVADLHNVYSLIASRAAEEHASAAARSFLRREAKLLVRAERDLARRADALFAVSTEECGYYRAAGARVVQLVPNGVACDDYASLSTGRPGAEPLILYIGTMSWSPNVAAARFLADQVLPAVRAVVPSARLRIIGKNPPSDLAQRHGRDGVEVTGAVPDVRPHLAAAALLAVPLETGGGTRLKILEGFAAGLPVVSTPIGAEGIDCASGEHLIITERTGFGAAITSLLVDNAIGCRLAAGAREMVRRTYDWPVVVSSALQAIGKLSVADQNTTHTTMWPARASASRLWGAR